MGCWWLPSNLFRSIQLYGLRYRIRCPRRRLWMVRKQWSNLKHSIFIKQWICRMGFGHSYILSKGNYRRYLCSSRFQRKFSPILLSQPSLERKILSILFQLCNILLFFFWRKSIGMGGGYLWRVFPRMDLFWVLCLGEGRSLPWRNLFVWQYLSTISRWRMRWWVRRLWRWLRINQCLRQCVRRCSMLHFFFLCTIWMV